MKVNIVIARSVSDAAIQKWCRWIASLALAMTILISPLYAQEHDAAALATLQGQLVRVGGDIRRIETRLQILNTRLDDLKLEGERLQSDYQKQRETMAQALSAMTRLRRMPKEAVLIRPGGPLQAARTTMLLQASLPAIETQTQEALKLLTAMENNQRELQTKADEARAAKINLDGAHASLNALLDKRRSEGGVRPEDLQAANRLVEDARSLRDLLSALEEDEGNAVAFIPQGLIPGLQDADGILPVSGIIRTRFGQKDEIGARASGLTIESLRGSLVVAPLPGIVRFAGAFKGYGNIVIIAHAGGYHSLVAGLGTIYVSPRQSIVSGEPLGILGAEKNQNQADQRARENVYYELRLHGQPVDPARKLPDLG